MGSYFVVQAAQTRKLSAAGREDPRKLGLPVERFQAVDLTRPHEAGAVVAEGDEACIVNFAARTDVDLVETERPSGAGQTSGGSAFAVNALAPEAMARAAHAAGKYLVTVSTDFVFEGTDGPYAEEKEPAPLTSKVSWYGWTKGEGERRVREASPHAAVVRISYPFRPPGAFKPDFAQAFLDRRSSGTLPPLYGDQQLTPSWVPDVSHLIEQLLHDRARGTFHIASPEVTTPFEFAAELFQRLDGQPTPLVKGSLESRLGRPGVTPRPLHGGLRCARAVKLGIPLTSWRRGIELWSEGRRPG